MNPTTREAIVSMVGHRLVEQPRYGATECILPDLTGGVALYVFEDDAATVRYVGSVSRPGQRRGVAHRLNKHLRTPAKRARWKYLTVFILSDATARSEVLALEGETCIWLSPTDGLAWPRARWFFS